MGRRPIEPIEIVCPTCGLIAELYRPRGSRRPKLCSCPTEETVTPARRPRVCASCTTVLNRYNRGDLCGACRVRSEGPAPEAARRPPAGPG